MSQNSITTATHESLQLIAEKVQTFARNVTEVLKRLQQLNIQVDFDISQQISDLQQCLTIATQLPGASSQSNPAAS